MNNVVVIRDFFDISPDFNDLLCFSYHKFLYFHTSMKNERKAAKLLFSQFMIYTHLVGDHIKKAFIFLGKYTAKIGSS